MKNFLISRNFEELSQVSPVLPQGWVPTARERNPAFFASVWQLPTSKYFFHVSVDRNNSHICKSAWSSTELNYAAVGLLDVDAAEMLIKQRLTNYKYYVKYFKVPRSKL